MRFFSFSTSLFVNIGYGIRYASTLFIMYLSLLIKICYGRQEVYVALTNEKNLTDNGNNGIHPEGKGKRLVFKKGKTKVTQINPDTEVIKERINLKKNIKEPRLYEVPPEDLSEKEQLPRIVRKGRGRLSRSPKSNKLNPLKENSNSSSESISIQKRSKSEVYTLKPITFYPKPLSFYSEPTFYEVPGQIHERIPSAGVIHDLSRGEYMYANRQHLPHLIKPNEEREGLCTIS